MNEVSVIIYNNNSINIKHINEDIFKRDISFKKYYEIYEFEEKKITSLDINNNLSYPDENFKKVCYNIYNIVQRKILLFWKTADLKPLDICYKAEFLNKEDAIEKAERLKKHKQVILK